MLEKHRPNWKLDKNFDWFRKLEIKTCRRS